CAVRSVIQTNRAEAFVKTSQELSSLIGRFTRRLFAFKVENIALNQVTRRFRHKGILIVFGTKQLTAINDRSACRCEISQTQSLIQHSILISADHTLNWSNQINPVIVHNNFVETGNPLLIAVRRHESRSIAIAQQSL